MVTKSSLAVIQPGGGVPARAKAKPAASGLALINEVLDADIVQAMVDADRFRLQVQREDTYLGGEGEIRPELLEGAKPLHRRWLPDSARAFAAYDCLTEMTFPGAQRFPLTQADASTMLHYLFGAMGKRRNDEAAAKLLACVDTFSPASNALGPALGLWGSTPRHPAILAIAIKQLMAAKT